MLNLHDDHRTARSLFERALAIHEKVLGPNHPDTATSLSTHKQKEAEVETNTFHTIAEEHVSRLAQQGRSDASIEKTKWLLTFADPAFGDLPSRKIDSATVSKPCGKSRLVGDASPQIGFDQS
jgi:Tetratricopeptide repeat